MSKTESIIAIVGPTASGKTETAILLSEMLQGEIISADSMAVYRGMDIGTAKPSAMERTRARFHVIDIVDPNEKYDAYQFCQDAGAAEAWIRNQFHYPVVCGGTGLYVKSFLQGYSLTGSPASPEKRSEIAARIESEGLPSLYEYLKVIDPRAAERIHFNDRFRISRAVEVFELSGKPLSQWQLEDAENRKPKLSIKFGIQMNRELLKSRIERRVDTMISNGLFDEVRSLLDKGLSPDLLPFQSVGYKESVAFITGECSGEEAIAAIKSNTIKLAKRQMTWFKADHEIIWLPADELTPLQVAGEINAIVQKQKKFNKN